MIIVRTIKMVYCSMCKGHVKYLWIFLFSCPVPQPKLCYIFSLNVPKTVSKDIPLHNAYKASHYFTFTYFMCLVLHLAMHNFKNNELEVN